MQCLQSYLSGISQKMKQNGLGWKGPQGSSSYLQSSTSGTAGRDNFIFFVSVGIAFSKSSKKLTFAWFILPGAQVTLLLLLAFKKVFTEKVVKPNY